MSTKLNVYGFGVQLKSDIATGNQGGRNMAVISASPDGARADLVEYVGADLARLSGPTVIVEGALYAAGEDAPPALPVCLTTPAVDGVGAEGETLTCTMGIWSGEPTSYSYQWQSDDAPVSSGTSNEYVVAATDVGKSITCIVTGTNAAGSADAPPSNAIAVPGAAKSSHHRK